MPTTADKIRKLLDEGKTRSEVARILGVAYQQVFQVDKKRHIGQGSHASTPVQRPPTATTAVSVRGPRGYGALKGPQLRFGTTSEAFDKQGGKIRTGPTQVRIAVQDGHEVRLYQGPSGTECFECREPIQYSMRDLAYVHTHSGSPVTRLINMQTGPGLFD